MNELHPVIFALITYGITAVIAVCVALVVKIISFLVQRKKATADEGAGPNGQGGQTS
jgi:hypothetical protein